MPGRARAAYGVLLHDAAGTVVGDAARGNVIVANIGDGVRLEGSSTIGSVVGNNWIGRLRRVYLSVPNGGAGVRLRDGASVNTVGASLPLQMPGLVQQVPAPNRIRSNAGQGIVVEGGTTVSNSLLDNLITGHAGLGIDNVAGGNRELAPPVVTSTGGGRARGTASGVSDGSLVQVFCDPLDEGFRWIGEERVTSEAPSRPTRLDARARLAILTT